MSSTSTIEWTDATWNPVTGCTKISEGCRYCYIDRTPPFRIKRISFDKPGIGGTTGVTLHPDRLFQPLTWKKPSRVFVNSLSDLFHDDVSDQFIANVFAVMAFASQHVFQILTKRPRRMQNLLSKDGFRVAVESYMADIASTQSTLSLPYDWDSGRALPLPNVWLGTSVENQKAADLRIPLLLQTPAARRFLSCEPLLGTVNLAKYLPRVEVVADDDRVHYRVPVDHDIVTNQLPNLRRRNPQTRYRLRPDVEGDSFFHPGPYVDWVIVGGESGPKARPMHPDWARKLRDQCRETGVPFFFKQWGEWGPIDALEYRGNVAEICLRFNGEVDPDALSMSAFLRRKGKKNAGRELDGRTWDEMPESVVA